MFESYFVKNIFGHIKLIIFYSFEHSVSMNSGHYWRLHIVRSIYEVIPNTAVFGPTKLIETTIASTTWMTVYADEKVYGFLNLDF